MNIIEKEIKERFEKSAFAEDGVIERMQSRIDKLEDAVAHLMGFIADKLRLTEDEIDAEDGLTDF